MALDSGDRFHSYPAVRCATPISGMPLIDDGKLGEDPLASDEITAETAAVNTISQAISEGALPANLPKDSLPIAPKKPLLDSIPPLFEINASTIERAGVPENWTTCHFYFSGPIKIREDMRVIRQFAEDFHVTVKCYMQFGIIAITRDNGEPFSPALQMDLLDIIKMNMKLTGGRFYARFDTPPLAS